MIDIFYRILSRIVEVLIILGATIIVCTVTVEVVLRYLFGLSLIFTEELSRYLMVWIVFLGSAIAIRDGSHIKITVLVKHFSHKTQQVLSLIAYTLTAFFLVIISVEGIKILPQQLYQMCITMNISLFYFYLAIPIGSVLMIIFLLPYIVEVFRGKVSEDNSNKEGQNLPC